MSLILRSMLVILIVIFVTSCTQKVPENITNNYGLLAIPVKITNKPGGKIGPFYYVMKSRELSAQEIIIKPKQGSSFALSEPLQAGKYQFTYVKSIASQMNTNLITNYHKYERNISPITIYVEPGKVTMIGHLFHIVNKNIGPQSYSSSWTRSGLVL